MEIDPMAQRCSWCGHAIADLDIYVRRGTKFFCSDRHYREWQDADSQWGEDGGMIHRHGDTGDFGMRHHRDNWGHDDGMALDRHGIED